MNDPEVVKSVEGIMRAANGYSKDLEKLLHDAIINEHRYTQGTIISVLCRVLYRVGVVNNGTDGRNENAINLCRALVRISDNPEKASPEDIKMISRFFFASAS